jgi:hypothetical protein
MVGYLKLIGLVLLVKVLLNAIFSKFFYVGAPRFKKARASPLALVPTGFCASVRLSPLTTMI